MDHTVELAGGLSICHPLSFLDKAGVAFFLWLCASRWNRLIDGSEMEAVAAVIWSTERR